MGLKRRRTLPPDPLRYVVGTVVRQAVRRKNEAEIANRKAGALTRTILRVMPGGE